MIQCSNSSIVCWQLHSFSNSKWGILVGVFQMSNLEDSIFQVALLFSRVIATRLLQWSDICCQGQWWELCLPSTSIVSVEQGLHSNLSGTSWCWTGMVLCCHEQHSQLETGTFSLLVEILYLWGWIEPNTFTNTRGKHPTLCQSNVPPIHSEQSTISGNHDAFSSRKNHSSVHRNTCFPQGFDKLPYLFLNFVHVRGQLCFLEADMVSSAAGNTCR